MSQKVHKNILPRALRSLLGSPASLWPCFPFAQGVFSMILMSSRRVWNLGLGRSQWPATVVHLVWLHPQSPHHWIQLRDHLMCPHSRFLTWRSPVEECDFHPGQMVLAYDFCLHMECAMVVGWSPSYMASF